MSDIIWPRYAEKFAGAVRGRTIESVEGMESGAPAMLVLRFSDGSHLEIERPAEDDDRMQLGFADPGASTRPRPCPPELNQELTKRDQLARAHQAAQALTDQLAVALDQRREEMAVLRARAEKAEALLAAVVAEAEACEDETWICEEADEAVRTACRGILAAASRGEGE